MFIIEILVGFSALAAATYCMVLSRRLKALSRLDGDVGQAIAVLSAQVDALTLALKSAETTSQRAESDLERQMSRAEAASRRLELMMSSLHTNDTDTCDAPKTGTTGRAPGLADFAAHGRADTTRARDARSAAVGTGNATPRAAVVRRRDKARA